MIRLLAALDDVHAPASNDNFADGLCRWFDWTDAISLSAALDGPAATPQAGLPAANSASTASNATSAEDRDYRRVRAALAKLAASPAVDAADDFAPHRQRYAAWQQAMEAAIPALRRRVRATLAGASPAMARLASLDTVMDQVVGARERVLLSTVPSWLEQRFERLRRAAPEGWLATFSQDMREVLLAELDLRLQPVEGLLEALRGPTPD